MDRTIQHVTIYADKSVLITYTDRTVEAVRPISVTMHKEMSK